MKHFSSLRIFISLIASLFALTATQDAKACYANFTYSNACAGDTVWFYAADLYAVYTWDFGDSTGEVNVNHDTTTWHVYTEPGTYFVSLFVNIGAEWDYHYEVITIGETCLNADFTYACGSSGYEYFYNSSVGGSSFFWDFGDPLSGVNDTSSLINPYHQYPAGGNYIVTLITSDGTDADTITQNILVDYNCNMGIGATIYPGTWGLCAGDSIVMNVSYTGTITSYSWDFGDPASGSDNVSVLDFPAHVYDEPGCYLVTLVISDGIETDTVYAVFDVQDCTCWPGDANGDGEVKCDDIFPIGMFYLTSGTPRANAGNSFTSQVATDWSGFGNFMYLQRLMDMKMADSNGNGTIDNNDLIAINNNYGMRHNNHNNVSNMQEATAADPTLWLDFGQTEAQQGTTVTATIYLGSANIPVNNLYGYSFTVNYDPALVVQGSVSVNLSNNWLGNNTNELMITHDDYVNGQIDAAVVRYDKVQLASGFGQIGTVTFQLKQNVSGTLHAFFGSSAKVLSTTMYSSTVSSNMQVFKPVNLVSDDLVVLNPAGISEYQNDNALSLFPNPTSGIVSLMPANNTVLSDISLFNTAGQLVFIRSGNFSSTVSINTADFAAGIYTLSCKTNNGIVMKKLSVVK